MNQILQTICPHIQESLTLPPEICPTAEVIFEKWGINPNYENQLIPTITRVALDYLQTFAAKLGLVASPLHHSLYTNDVQRLIRLALIDKQDVHFYVDPYEKTLAPSLFLTIHRDNQDVFKALLQDLGTDIHYQHKNDMNTTALHSAAVGSHIFCIKMLLNAGADVNAKLDGGLTPLHLATLAQDNNALETLIKAGASPHAKDDHGNTALHYAAKFGNKAATETLLKAKAHPYEKNNKGEMPHVVAFFNNQEEIVNLLQKIAPMPADEVKSYMSLVYERTKTQLTGLSKHWTDLVEHWTDSLEQLNKILDDALENLEEQIEKVEFVMKNNSRAYSR